MSKENFTIEIERDMIDVTSITEPDPDWVYTCSCNITHSYNIKDGEVIWPLFDTLVWIVDTPATDEYPEYGHYECCECGEEIKPGKKPGEKKEIAGRIRIKLDGNRIGSKEEFITFLTNKGYSKEEAENMWPN